MIDDAEPAGKPGEDDMLVTYKKWYAIDLQKAQLWRSGKDGDGGAVEDFKFRDGDQYSDEDKRELQDQRRPIVVFNRTGVLVDAVVGSEIGNRREVRYIPREMADAKPNELLTSAAEWFRDQCDAEDEESEAFKDTVTAGMGWTETRMDFESNPQGDAKIERISPFEMVWDASAQKANLVDTERRWRVRKMSKASAQKLFPDADEDDLHAAWAEDGEDDDEPRSINPGNRYAGEEDPKAASDGKVTIVACQYFKTETYYQAIIMTPEGQPQEAELDEAKFKVASKAGAVLKHARRTRKTVVQCFLGRVVLKKPEPTQTGTFSWNCITGLKDEDNGTFYGIVRRAKDPQRWANKWLSQMMHILNSQAKGGIMAEDGAFENEIEAERDWAKPNGITKMAQHALSSPNGPKILPKPVAQFPSGFDRLLQYADDAIVKSTGINMEMLGMREVNQPGVLEYQRKQSGIAILASFFDGLRRYRKIQGRAMLKLIQNYLSDGRMVRILGDDQARYEPLTREKVADIEYDIIVDDAPSSTNEKEKTWQILMQVLPMIKDSLGPKQGLILAKYSPLPTSLVEEITQSVQQQGEAPPDPMQQQAMQLQQQQQALEGEKLQLELAKVQADREKTAMEMRKLEVEGQTAVMQQETDRQRNQVDAIGAYAALQDAQNSALVTHN